MTLRTKLAADHVELDHLAERLQAIVAGPAPTADFAAVRWRLNHRLTVHLAQEDNYLYPMLARSSDPVTRALADRSAKDMGSLFEQHRAYSARWSGKAIETDWPGFARETRAIMALLRKRIHHEELELYHRLDAA